MEMVEGSRCGISKQALELPASSRGGLLNAGDSLTITLDLEGTEYCVPIR